MEISEPVWAGELDLGELTGVDSRRSFREVYEMGLIERRSKSPDDGDEEGDDVVAAEADEEEFED